MQSLKRFPIMLLFLIAINIFLGSVMSHETQQGIQESPWLAAFWVLAASLTLLAIFWFCFSPKTVREAEFLKKFNWMFLGVWALALILMAIKKPSIDLALLAMVYAFLLLLTAGYNKFLFAQAFPQSDTAKELALPYYTTKHQVDMLKTFAVGFPIGIAFVLGLVAGFGTDIPWYYGAMLGFCVGLFLSCWLLPAWFIKQTATPSLGQRLARRYVIALVLAFMAKGIQDDPHAAQVAITKVTSLLDKKQRQLLMDLDYYKFWLSHPGVEITPQLREQIGQLDLGTFDWQNPAAWPDLPDLPTKEII